MSEFIAEEGPLKGLVLSLTDGDSWLIGRDPDECDLIIEDPKASRKHLLAKKVDGGILLENLSHSNPTKVNGKQILEPVLLHSGDKVQVGGTLFRFYTEDGAHFSEEFLGNAQEGGEEKLFDETIFKEEDAKEIPVVHFDLKESRFIFKVIAGPNTGAELALDEGRQYTIGTDTEACDIVFHDLSVSRTHAKIKVDSEGKIEIEDLESRNGVLVGRERIVGHKTFFPNTLVTIGTSVFLILDKEAPHQTISSPILEMPEEEGEEVKAEEPIASLNEKVESPAFPPKKPFSTGTFLLTLFSLCFIILLGLGMISLFQSKEVKPKTEDHHREIERALSAFPQVKFTFNAQCGRLFLVGHVSTGLQKSEMFYNLKTLRFIQGIDDHVIDDEAVWQETNILLSKIPAFEGVSMHSPEAGRFVLTGFLKTSAQASALMDYMNLNFNYLDRLENCVVVEEEVLDEVRGSLMQGGFNGVTTEYTNGQLLLTGYIPTTNQDTYLRLVGQFESIPGVRQVRNYVVALSPEQAIVDLNESFPGKYQVTGYSKHGNINVNVVINGCILMRGDTIDGMTITSIQAHTIFLEKDGLKYKVEYNIRECVGNNRC